MGRSPCDETRDAEPHSHSPRGGNRPEVVQVLEPAVGRTGHAVTRSAASGKARLEEIERTGPSLAQRRATGGGTRPNHGHGTPGRKRQTHYRRPRRGDNYSRAIFSGT